MAACAHGAPTQTPAVATAVTATPRAETPLPELSVSELLEPGALLRPSAKALALAGQRVRLVGYVAELEEQPAGAVFMTSSPVHCDEAGGGTADLPPDAVLVSGAALANIRVEHVHGAVEAVGVLSVENRADAQGRVSNFQVALDAPSGP